MTRNELEAKKVFELECICKHKNLTYYSNRKHLTKGEMIEKILGEEKKTEEVKVETSESGLAKVFSENDKEELQIDRDQKDSYIDKAEVGAIVAFYDENGKARSAAIKNKSTKNKKLKVETEFGREFIVPYDKVMWVKTKNRWPKGVYDILKGRA